MNAREKEVPAMLFYGDEPTGEMKIMLLVELFVANKKFRQDYIDAPLEVTLATRMYEWRWNSPSRKQARHNKRRNT